MRTQKFRFISACRDNLLFFPSFGITQRPDKQPSLVKTSLPDVRTLIKRRFRSVINSLAYRPTTIRARRSRENTQRCQRQIRLFFFIDKTLWGESLFKGNKGKEFSIYLNVLDIVCFFLQNKEKKSSVKILYFIYWNITICLRIKKNKEN